MFPSRRSQRTLPPMGNYPGKRKGTRRIVIWAQGRPREWVIRGTKADGERFEARKRLEMAEGAVSQRSAVGFSTLCRAYLVHAETHLKLSTWKVRRYVVATIMEHFGERKVDSLTPLMVEGLKQTRLAKVSAYAVNNDLRALSAVCAYGRRMGHPIPKFTVQLLPERGHGRVRTWSLEELDRIFSGAVEKAPLMLPMLVFLANTGCRKGEAIAAEWSWVDLKAGLIRIPATDYWQPKSGRPREVPISDALRVVLEEPPRSNRWLFPNRSKRRFKNFPHLVWQKALKASKVKGNPHMFRHTFASMFLQRQPDLFLLAEILGHSSTKITELYAHLLPGHLERARNAVNVAPTMVPAMATRKPKAKKA